MKINIKNIRLKGICATLFLSCNNGIEELEKKNQFLSSLVNLGNDFLIVFTSFVEIWFLILLVLRFVLKQDIEKYFIINSFLVVSLD
ncbi:hypothetical protein bcCo53_001747 (plasmid) [Borrelia coriaceae]|uniref:hypothetical protein n=1 Tax=Borrelia coriaceae TaxID=144 RepID=UPI000486E265|nr:hypothetical protein [Borrelia coriaceae]UPA17534.1 hypothetical protein bcCo53_001747 [Borrelia coriaceae]